MPHIYSNDLQRSNRFLIAVEKCRSAWVRRVGLVLYLELTPPTFKCLPLPLVMLCSENSQLDKAQMFNQVTLWFV